MNMHGRHLLLADDDLDDCAFFKEALKDLSLQDTLAIVNDGEALMQVLEAIKEPLPDLLFLDLNMPRRNGIECLEKIKRDNTLKSLPVIIYSTSFNKEVVDLLYQQGAQYYIRKPGNYTSFKKVIHDALSITYTSVQQPSRDKFILHA